MLERADQRHQQMLEHNSAPGLLGMHLLEQVDELRAQLLGALGVEDLEPVCRGAHSWPLHERPALSAVSIMPRIAADREGAPLRVAQASTALMSSAGNRSATSGSLPVAGRPRPRFFGITFIDFRAIAGLYLKRHGPRKRPSDYATCVAKTARTSTHNQLGSHVMQSIPSITDLYSRFATAVAARELISDDTEENRLRWERAGIPLHKLAGRIVAAPAANADEVLLKIRVVGWAIGAGEKLEELDHWTPGRLLRGEEYTALASIREDLRRMAA